MRVLSLLALFTLTCGGGRSDVPARVPALALTTSSPAPPPMAPVAAPTRPLPAVPAPAPPLPPPPDALSEALAHESVLRSGFAKRFPKHGVAYQVLSPVYERPERDAEVLGYMRRGQRFRASALSAGSGCHRGWFTLPGGGFVCRGEGFALGDEPQSFEPAPAPATALDTLPYRYAKTHRRDVLQFWRPPTPAEQQQALALAVQIREEADAETERSEAVATTPAPQPPTSGTDEPAEGEEPLEPPDPDALDERFPDYVRMVMQPGFYVSLDGQQPDPEETRAVAGSPMARTVRGAFVDSAALEAVTAPAAPGVVLDARHSLPMAFSYRGEARRLLRHAGSGALERTQPLPRMASTALAGPRIEHEGRPYYMSRDGSFVSANMLRVARSSRRPPLVPRGARWIHVDLLEQVLVAYEGDTPVFATLISSGKEGHETPQGLFRIHTKHVSTTMDGLAGTDEVYSIEDVPWTMYFHGSFALHAAFWHDRFGRTRSHGCVNLAPDDARWLFRWTTPELPPGLHGVRALEQNPGTFVYVVGAET
ncbi:MAG: L,D-transpeptidase family protein [Myxococcales bacterium]|nr:L,D-transpeptidase family protein [Myxococcales bacterium]